MFLNMIIFKVRSCQHLSQLLSWRTTLCRLSASAYSIYSAATLHIGGRSSIRSLRSHYIVVTGTHHECPQYRGADKSLARPRNETSCSDQDLQHYTKTYGTQTKEMYCCFLYAISLGIVLYWSP